MFLNLPVELIQRLFQSDGEIAITIGNLLGVLHNALHIGDGVPIELQDVIVGAANTTDVVVATTVVPSFDIDCIQNQLHGYRSLGALSLIEAGSDLTPLSFEAG